MNSAHLQRIYENACLDASRVARQFSWLSDEDSEVDECGECRNEFRFTAVVPGCNEREMLSELIDLLRARADELELSLKQHAPRRIMSPSAGQRSACDEAAG